MSALGTPDKGHHINVKTAADEHCSRIRDYTAEMTETEGSYFFCHYFDLKDDIFSEEVSYLDNITPFPVSHKRLCRRWLKKHGPLEGQAKERLEFKIDKARTAHDGDRYWKKVPPGTTAKKQLKPT